VEVNFPRYTREENRSCKLTDEQIRDIPILLSKGVGLSELANAYGVVKSTISYWALSPKKRKEQNIKYACKKRDKDAQAISRRKYNLRKRELYGEEFNAFVRQAIRIFKNKYPDVYKKQVRAGGERYISKLKDKDYEEYRRRRREYENRYRRKKREKNILQEA